MVLLTDIAFVNGLGSVLLSIAPFLSLGCLVAAGVALRGEGGTNFQVGGRFSRWMFWALLFGALPSVPALLTHFGVPGITGSFSGGSAEFGGLVGAVQGFVQVWLVDKLVPVIAGCFVLKAVLDSGQGSSPLPSLVVAIFLLSVNGVYVMVRQWDGTGAFAITTGFSAALQYVGTTVCPISASFCFIGAVVQYIKGGRWGYLVLTGMGLLSFTGIWAMVQTWG